MTVTDTSNTANKQVKPDTLVGTGHNEDTIVIIENASEEQESGPDYTKEDLNIIDELEDEDDSERTNIDKIKKVAGVAMSIANSQKKKKRAGGGAIFPMPHSATGQQGQLPQEGWAATWGPNGWFGQYSQNLTCPNCDEDILTTTKTVPGQYALTWSIGLVVTGLFLFAWIPCCLRGCRNVRHFCPECGIELGRFIKRR